MLFVFSLIFNGCVTITSPTTINVPFFGTYYSTQNVVIKKQYIKAKSRELYILPKTKVYKINDIKEDGKERFSIPKVQLFKAQQSCALKGRRIASYEDMIRRSK